MEDGNADPTSAVLTSRHPIENKYFARNPFAFNILQAPSIW